MHSDIVFSIFNYDVYWYDILIALGIFLALLVYCLLSSKVKLSADAFLFYGVIIVLSIAAGFLFARLFQGIYDLIERGKTSWKGITFMGGLVGGAATFLLLSFVSLLYDRKIFKSLWKVVCIAPLCITIAHSFGRIGCYCAGCCYGKKTNSSLGVYFLNGKRYPTQLYEAVFLAILFVVLLVIFLKYKKYSLTMLIYMYSYAVFRFLLEFLRGDPRGKKGIFAPSQWMSVLMLLAAGALTFYIFKLKRIPCNGKKSELSLKQLCEFV